MDHKKDKTLSQNTITSQELNLRALVKLESTIIALTSSMIIINNY